MRTLSKVSITVLVALSSVAYASSKTPSKKHTKTIVVAVIDSGINPYSYKENFLCKSGHRDFTGTGIIDRIGHGTHVSTTIDQYVKNIHPRSLHDEEFASRLATKKVPYCQLILKYFDVLPDENNQLYLQQALRWAIDMHADVINYSGGGENPIPEERLLIEEALDKGIKVIAAAGNNSKQLEPFDKSKDEQYTCDIKIHKCYIVLPPSKDGKKPKKKSMYFPAQYDSRVVMVGNLKSKLGDRAPSSNWGPLVTYWEVGTDVLSLGGDWRLMPLTGTSQATAIKTGKIVRGMLIGH